MSILNNDEIECPYCGFKFFDSWEFCLGHHKEEIVRCDNMGCKKEFALNIDYTTNFWSCRIKVNDEKE